MIDFAPCGQRRGECIGVLADGRFEDLNRRPMLGGVFEQLNGAVHVVRAKHHVHVTGPFDDRATVLLRQTPADRDLKIRPFGLERLQMTELAVQLVVCILADAARVEHNHIGLVEAIGPRHSVRFKQTREALRVMLVHLTPVGAN